MSSRARKLAGFVTAISPVTDLNVGVITATRFDGPFDVTVGYARTAGIATYAINAGAATIADNANLATLASGLSGNPDIVVNDIDASTIDLDTVNATGVITATSFIGDGSQLENVGGGLGIPVTGSGGMFNAVALSTTFNSSVNLNDTTAGVGSHYVTVTSPILVIGPSGDVTVGEDKQLVIDPLPLPSWS